MLYDGENPIFKVVEVAHLHWDGGDFKVAPRGYSALAFRISGSAVISYRDRERFVNTNDILYLPQGLGYNAEYTDTELIVIHFITQSCDTEIEVYTPDNCEEIYKMFLRAHTLWNNKEVGCNMQIMSLLYKILGAFFASQSKIGLPPHFLKAVSFINSSYKDSAINVKTVCANAGISETVFRQTFKKHYRKTPIEYITDLRLEYARNLISSGISVEQAAFESGYNDPKYFARAVKKKMGCTPRELKYYGK